MMGSRNTAILTSSVAFVFLAVAIYYLILKSFLLVGDTADFKYIWLGGHVWGLGQNPYSDIFGQIGEEMFVDTNRPRTLFYPPSWWAIALPMSKLPYEDSYHVWRIINAGLLLLGCAVAIWGYHKAVRPVSILTFTAVVFFACVTSATATTLAMGQTSIIVFLACSCFFAAYIRDNQLLMIIALFLMTLKPTVGIIFWAFLIADRQWWSSIFLAGLVFLISCIPAFWISGVIPVIQSYLAGLEVHGKLAPNIPQNMTGLRNTGYYLLGLDLSVTKLTLTGTAIAVGLGFWIQRMDKADTANRLVVLGGLLVTIAVFVPLHTYDNTMYTLLILVAMVLPFWPRIVFFVGMVALLRYNNLADVLGFGDLILSPGSLLTSVVTFVMFVTLAAALFLPTQRPALNSQD